MSKPKIPQKSPMVIEVEAGTHAWCSCGESSKQPYCDGSHTGSDFTPIIEKVEEKKTVAWCGCKHSANGAFCDGSHSKL
ncbi:MAG: glutamate synthase [Crocinitomix sp. MedPE-SWsnd]|jgi:CDGSH-type Zn-finger protein|nr:MAG: glutamate synthase [Crocinitomix sp. MedPE-SWsnd]